MLSIGGCGILERYRDVIVNGLDLASFLCTTPLLLRVVAPTIGFFSAYFLVAWLAAIPLVLFMILMILFHLNGAVMLVGVMVTFAVLSALESATEKLTAELKDLTVRYALLVGISLFLLSRLIAFTMAMYEVLEGAK